MMVFCLIFSFSKMWGELKHPNPSYSTLHAIYMWPFVCSYPLPQNLSWSVISPQNFIQVCLYIPRPPYILACLYINAHIFWAVYISPSIPVCSYPPPSIHVCSSPHSIYPSLFIFSPPPPIYPGLFVYQPSSFLVCLYLPIYPNLFIITPVYPRLFIPPPPTPYIPVCLYLLPLNLSWSVHFTSSSILVCSCIPPSLSSVPVYSYNTPIYSALFIFYPHILPPGL